MRRRLCVLAALVVTALAGCGIGTDRSPRDIAAGDTPFTLDTVDTAPPQTTAAPGNPKVYLVGTDGLHLVGSNRDVNTLNELLKALLEGPTAQDSEKSFTSAIPLNTTLVKTQIDATILTITLKTDPNGPSFAGPNGPKAFAQLVYTATSDPEKVRGVRFVVNDLEIGINGDGIRVIDRPLTKADFANQAPVAAPDVKPPGGSLVTTTTITQPPTTTTTTSTTVASTTAPATTA